MEVFHSTRGRKKWSHWQQNVLKMALHVMTFPYKKKTSFSFTMQSRGFCDMTGQNHLHCSFFWNEDKSAGLDYMCSDEE
jgi:hypothetical protein